MENANKLLDKYGKYNLEVKLLKSLEDALDNKEFEEFVSKLNLSKEKLCKYTSCLEESYCEYSHCKNCKGLVECQNKIIGYAYLPKKNKDKIEFYYKACKYENKSIKNEKKYENVYVFEIPKMIREASMKNIYLEDKDRFTVIKWLKNFIKSYPNVNKGLYLNGTFGSGKTYLIAAAFNELSKNGIKSAIVFWPEYLNKLKSSFNGDKDEFKTLIEKIKKVPLLLIDDIGAENVTAWSRDEILAPILQYRMEEELITFFTSNFDLKSLEKHLSISSNAIEEIKSRRIMERIKQLTENLDLITKNLRK